MNYCKIQTSWSEITAAYKKDPFYLYKAWWNTNDANNGKLSLYVNNSFVEEANVTDNIALFTAYNFSSGDVVRVDGGSTSDTFTFGS